MKSWKRWVCWRLLLFTLEVPRRGRKRLRTGETAGEVPLCVLCPRGVYYVPGRRRARYRVPGPQWHLCQAACFVPAYAAPTVLPPPRRSTASVTIRHHHRHNSMRVASASINCLPGPVRWGE